MYYIIDDINERNNAVETLSCCIAYTLGPGMV